MTEQTPTPAAAELRAAAQKLRALAEAATDGPWWVEDWAARWGEERDARLVGSGKILAELPYDVNGLSNALLIAAMHPGVALALAAWLEHEAGLAEQVVYVGLDGRLVEHALAVARALNAEVTR